MDHYYNKDGTWYRNIKGENITCRLSTNQKITDEDRERLHRRRKLEAILEAKKMRQLDDIDEQWIEDWS